LVTRLFLGTTRLRGVLRIFDQQLINLCHPPKCGEIKDEIFHSTFKTRSLSLSTKFQRIADDSFDTVCEAKAELQLLTKPPTRFLLTHGYIHRLGFQPSSADINDTLKSFAQASI
jgi:hypothetical protein